jgi:hypothetical protein
MIRVNRDQRRFLEAVVRSDTDAWFIVTTDHVEVSEEGAEFGVVCGKLDVTFTLSYAALFNLEVALQARGCSDSVLSFGSGDEHVWRYSPKRGGYYPEVGLCTFCGGVHLPVLTKASLEAIIKEAYAKGMLPREPSHPARPAKRPA